MSTDEGSSGRQPPEDFSERRVAWEEAVPILREFARVQPQDRVLDLACGDGILAFELARRCAYLVGVDRSETMIAAAVERCLGTGVDNLSFQVGDAHHLDFPDGSFERVVCRLGLHHFTEPIVALREVSRVLTSPGQLILADLVSSEDKHWREIHNRLERSRDPSHVQMYAPSQIRTMLDEAGFTLEHEIRWQSRRRFGEWMKLANADRATVERTRKLMMEAFRKKTTDLDIAIRGKVLEFTHQWVAWTALKLV